MLLHCGIYRHAKQFVTTVILGTDEHFFIYFFLARTDINDLDTVVKCAMLIYPYAIQEAG